MAEIKKAQITILDIPRKGRYDFLLDGSVVAMLPYYELIGIEKDLRLEAVQMFVRNIMEELATDRKSVV